MCRSLSLSPLPASPAPPNLTATADAAAAVDSNSGDGDGGNGGDVAALGGAGATSLSPSKRMGCKHSASQWSSAQRTFSSFSSGSIVHVEYLGRTAATRHD